MDLHDYRDVAENYDRYLEVMYEHDNHHEHFQEFYLELARKYGSGGIVDVACGTGAVLLYLAEHGMAADGTDLSEEMCRVAAKKAEAMGLKLNIFPADMTAFSSGRKYSLAIIARSGFMHLPDQRLQEAALRNLRDQLLPGGILTLNTLIPGRRCRRHRWEQRRRIILSGWSISTARETGRRSITRSPIIPIRSRCTGTGSLRNIMTAGKSSGKGSARC